MAQDENNKTAEDYIEFESTVNGELITELFKSLDLTIQGHNQTTSAMDYTDSSFKVIKFSMIGSTKATKKLVIEIANSATTYECKIDLTEKK